MAQVLTAHASEDLAETAEVSSRKFETADIVLASFLRCRNFDLLNLKRSSNGAILFVFLDSPELRHGIVDFANDGIVPVRCFYSTLRDFEAISRHAEPL